MNTALMVGTDRKTETLKRGSGEAETKTDAGGVRKGRRRIHASPAGIRL